ncbi:MAG: hypothetical protein AAGD11_00235 [Planctomycetota bacterium]
MTRFSHPAGEPAGRIPDASSSDSPDSHKPKGHPPSSNTQQVRSQLLKMILESERKRHSDTTKPVVPR